MGLRIKNINRSRVALWKHKPAMTAVLFIFAASLVYGVVASAKFVEASGTPFVAEATCVDGKAVLTLTTRQADLPGVKTGVSKWHAEVIYKTSKYGIKKHTLSENDVDVLTINTEKEILDAVEATARVVGGYTTETDVVLWGKKIISYDTLHIYDKTLTYTSSPVDCTPLHETPVYHSPDDGAIITKAPGGGSKKEGQIHLNLQMSRRQDDRNEIRYAKSLEELEVAPWVSTAYGGQSSYLNVELPNGTYYWQARARHKDDREGKYWSEPTVPRSFTVDLKPAVDEHPISPTGLKLEYLDGDKLTQLAPNAYIVKDSTKTLKLSWTNNFVPVQEKIIITTPENSFDHFLGAPWDHAHLNSDVTKRFGANGEGEYTYRVATRNADGHWSQPTEDVITVIYDKTRPEIELIAPDEGSYNPSEYSVSSKDNFALNIVTANLYDGADKLIKSCTVLVPQGENEYKLTCPAPDNLEDGSYTIRYNATDKAGNMSQTKKSHFTVDNTEEEITPSPENPVVDGEGGDDDDATSSQGGGSDEQNPEATPLARGTTFSRPSGPSSSGTVVSAVELGARESAVVAQNQDNMDVAEAITNDGGGEVLSARTVTSGQSWSLVNVLLTLGVALVGSAVLFGMGRGESRQQNVVRALSLMPIVGAVLLLFAVEDFTMSMGLVNSWTWLVAIIAVVQAVILSVTKMQARYSQQYNQYA